MSTRHSVMGAQITPTGNVEYVRLHKGGKEFCSQVSQFVGAWHRAQAANGLMFYARTFSAYERRNDVASYALGCETFGPVIIVRGTRDGGIRSLTDSDRAALDDAQE